ncbi:MAG: hypothetical protein IH971_06250 [Candidatus Marinimicrobia bacterium]|nr:hypothetical protein [Candidatus Neomarinimicrobiota bacterium]
MLKFLEMMGLSKPASAHGAEMDQLLALVHWLMAALLIGWGIYYVYVLLRFRSSKQPKAEYTGVTSHYSRYVEIGVTVVEAVLLIGFALPIWGMVKNEIPDEAEALYVRVVGEQFAWNIHYPGADGQFGRSSLEFLDAETNPLGLDPDDEYGADDITTINQLHLPVNKPVVILLSSKDVIHSFALPLMRVKQDAIPGLTIPVWFVPNRIVESEIACAQLCGLGHYRMRGFLTVESQDDYDAWQAEEAALKAEEAEGDWW